MKKIFKKITILFIFMFIGISHLNANTATMRVTSSSTSPIIGNTITISITISSSKPLGQWEFTLNYDTTKFKQLDNVLLRETEAGDGVRKSITYTYRFQAKALGSGQFKLTNYLMRDWDTGNTITPTMTPVTVTVRQPVVLSNDNTLKSLTLSKGKLSPTFNPGTLEYNIDIDELVNNITVTAIPNHTKATKSGDGLLQLKEGMNKYEITVLAENGSIKTYTLKINVYDKDPIETIINGKKYIVLKKERDIEIPENFEKVFITINENEVQAYENKKANLILVLLESEDEEHEFYIYANNTYIKYKEITSNNIKLLFEKADESLTVPKGFDTAIFTIQGIQVKGWDTNDNKTYKLVYALNLKDGKKDFYLYNSEYETFQKYFSPTIKEPKLFENISFIIVVSLLALSLILYIPLTIKIYKLKKIKTK